ncbi:regulatory protein MerR [Gemmatirosa kalamazoonensis]|uniref:Regulatory protein MerR n=1 Tax=Gemmatirosa kalamazoonensis TaxID=861299 RepID=W0RKD3_9BACT|nr:MerR family transcriptional regulator [Gemmatirosa kalamazoonensis]AHG90775.1 regulatory protein MerR [Gemmatirosa kalamazoonensis]
MTRPRDPDDVQTAARAATPRRAMRAIDEAVQEYFSIGEVCQLTDLKPHVLRYWESQFRILNPAKNRSGNRVYARREVELVLLVKHLLYTEKFTIDGARQRLEQHRRTGELRTAARSALAVETIALLERELRDIAGVLDGRVPPGTRTDDPSHFATSAEPEPLALDARPADALRTQDEAEE